MKLRELLIAVLVLVALGGLLYWSNHHKPLEPSAAASSTASPTILKMDQNSIVQLSLTHKGSEPITLTRAVADKWQIGAPKAMNVDQDAVSSVVSTLSNLNADRVVEDKASDLKQYGLDDPSVTIAIELKDHKDHKLLVGDDTPAGSDAYAMLAGEPKVFTIASFNKTSINKSVNDLRDKRLLTMAQDKISRVALEKNAQTIEFARTKDGWQILKPEPLRADNFAVDEFVHSVADTRMDLNGNDGEHAAAEFAQAIPVATVTLTGDQGPQTLTVRKSKDNYLAKSSAVDGTYKIDTSLGTALDKSLESFRNKKLFDFGFDEPNKIELHDGPKSWFFTRSGSDWWSNGKKMDSSGVESLVEKLRDLAATGFPDAGFSNPDFEATITSNDGKRIEKVSISTSGSDCIAKLDNEPSLYQLGPTAISDLIAAADGIKPAAKAVK